MTIQKFELLAPGGDVDAIKAAILAGANAVYCGLDRFNARNRAANISFDQMKGVIKLAHNNTCKVFLTLNILIIESEISSLVSLLNKLQNTKIDGIIVQDLGLLYLLSKYFRNLHIHASTQLTTHNKGQLAFLAKLRVERVNLSRELNIDEIHDLSTAAKKQHLETEVFVHGSYCISFSGLCYMSSVLSAKSGNRGRCSQPCREKYLTTPNGKRFPLNLKDNSAYFDVEALHEAGVDSLKIEGRIKDFEYVYTVVNTWRKQLDSLYDQQGLVNDNHDLHTVFNRDFTNGFLRNHIDKDMFIDNPMTNSGKHLSDIHHYTTSENMRKGEADLYAKKEKIRSSVKKKIDLLSIEKDALTMYVSGSAGKPLEVAVVTPYSNFKVHTPSNLASCGTQALNKSILLRRLKVFNDTEFFIQDMNLEQLDKDVYLPFRELTILKQNIWKVLNKGQEMRAPIDIPALEKKSTKDKIPRLSIVISSEKELQYCQDSNAKIFFMLPAGFKETSDQMTALFRLHPELIPWFPSILIGEDFDAAISFLYATKAPIIVSDNSGIAFEASKIGLAWIAGPNMNIFNSYSLLNLKENFSCAGAFVSNELSKEQIQNLKKPEDFELYYSIFHPINLMTSRQCLFQQVTECNKYRRDQSCLSDCSKTASITNLKGESFLIEKSKGNYHRIYHSQHFLNTQIMNDIPHLFSSFFIDMRQIKTQTKLLANKATIIQAFENLMAATTTSAEELQHLIQNTSLSQYIKGV